MTLNFELFFRSSTLKKENLIKKKKQYREEVVTSLCHGSKILNDNTPKIHLESKFSMFQTILFNFI